MEMICFSIISACGTARSMYIEAIQEAKQGNIEAARTMIKEAQQVFVEGHHAHAELIMKEANGEKTEIGLLLIHAEDQLMSAEAFGILSEEFVDMYERFGK